MLEPTDLYIAPVPTLCTPLLTHVEVAPAQFNCAHLGQQMVTLTVSDIWASTYTCQTTVLIQDQTAPILACNTETSIFLPNNSAVVEVQPSLLLAGSYDNCGTVEYALSQSQFDITDLGLNTVTVSATDFSGNTASCTATVQVLMTSGGVEAAVSEGFSARIWPNPSTHLLHINVQHSMANAVVQMGIFDANGRLLLNKNATSDHTIWDIKDLPSGSYFLKIFNQFGQNTIISWNKI